MIEHLHRERTIPKRVVLIGGTGFIGQHVGASLAAHEIDFISCGSSDVDLNQRGAISSLKRIFKRGDTIVMLAAITRDKFDNADAVIRNINMLKSVIAAIESIEVSHFIYLSSDAIYGSSSGMFTEDNPASPDTLYGAMHLTRELLLQRFVKVPTVICRPSAVYGFGDTHCAYGPNRFIKTAMQENRIILFGKGEELRDHVYVEDIAGLIIEIAMWRSIGRLNLVSGRACSFYDLAVLISELKGNAVTIEMVARSAAIWHRSFDASLINSAFPAFAMTNLRAGIKRTVNGYN